MTAIQYAAVFIGLTTGGILCFAWMIWSARPATPDDLPAEVPETNGEADLEKMLQGAGYDVVPLGKAKPAYIAAMNGVVVPKSDDCPF